MITMKFLSALFCVFCLNVLSIHGQVSMNKFPVVAYGAVPQDYTSPQQFKLLEEAGINVTFSHYKSLAKAKEALDLASKHGVKILLYCPELFSDTEKTVREVKDHPGLAGYLIGDEPNLGRFAYLNQLVNKIKAIDNKNICYINLFPNYASRKQLGGVNYNQYLDRFFSSFNNLSVYSFDHYPVKKGVLTTNWYENLEQFSEHTKKNKGVFWAFVKIVSIRDESEVINMPDLKLQTFANLAYGAQGIQFYRYWSEGQMFNGPMSARGTVNPNYDKLKQITRYVENLTPVFQGANVLQVYHTNKTRGARIFSSNAIEAFSFPSQADNLLVSHIENAGGRFVIFVNKDLKRTNKFAIKVNVNGSLIDKDFNQENISNGTVYDVSIDPGDLVILKYQ